MLQSKSLSFVTEHVAEHTNETIGALLNATFGNAPELLISKAALQNGFYRVVQLTLLGSVLTNLLFVFGFSCLIGGLQWQTQTLRITSGNVSIGMLLVATMGIILPAVLKLANESVSNSGIDNNAVNEEITESDIAFSRFNSLAMVTGYCCYLIFQLGSHKEEFDYDGNEFENHGRYQDIIKTHHFQKDFAMKKDFVRRNNFCKRYCVCMKYCPDVEVDNDECRHLYDDKEDIQFESSDSIIESQEDRKVSLRRIPQSLETNDRVNETMREEMKRELYANDNGDSTHDPLETSKKFSSKLSDYDGSFEVCDEKEPTMSMRVSYTNSTV
jgi:Ca2+/Na+ antiporter